jgi:hypothetical protein
MRRSETKASFGSKPYGSASYTECDLITHAFVEEVSVLIGQLPKEPLAQVVLLKREDSPAAERKIAGEPVIHMTGMISRPCGSVIGVR